MTSAFMVPPTYCHYSDGPCDQSFPPEKPEQVFFIYPSEPRIIAGTIETAIKAVSSRSNYAGYGWKNLDIAGRMVFCEICKCMRSSACIVADVTTLNFNLLFEIGFALGLGKPVLPIRDRTYTKDKLIFDQLGILDTVGYLDFTNVENLLSKLLPSLPGAPLSELPVALDRGRPLYVVKSPIPTEGSVTLMSKLKKSRRLGGFHTYDSTETKRLPLSELRRRVGSATGVICDLLSPARSDAVVHNGLCAFIGGYALAMQRVVALLQEEGATQPIDYRDIVLTYASPDQVSVLLKAPLFQVLDTLQADKSVPKRQKPENPLASVDLGALAAENEIRGLDSYFVATGHFVQARQGHSRLVVGRKGSGKTAIFYGVRKSVTRGHQNLILDLRPEGHQFIKLRETVLERMTPGVQEHTMVALWVYILMSEVARKIIYSERDYAAMDSRRLELYDAVREVYFSQNPSGDEDFSKRLLGVVDRVVEGAGTTRLDEMGGSVTQLVYRGDVQVLYMAVLDYLRHKNEVWLLLDNLDKGWPTQKTSAVDIVIIRSLLEAARKLEKEFQDAGTDFRCLVFLRSDIYEYVYAATPDKGKDVAITLRWDDEQLFQEIVKRRIASEAEAADVDFPEVWARICDSENMFDYMLERTLMRPRDILQFIIRGMEVALNRGHEVMTDEDVVQAERAYSEDLLLDTSYEIQDTNPDFSSGPFAFQGCPAVLTYEAASEILHRRIADASVDEAIEILMRYAFFGVTPVEVMHPKYAYELASTRRLLQQARSGDGRLVVHPGFRAALDMSL